MSARPSRPATAAAVELPRGRVARGVVVAPPSKSHAIRALVCAALSRAPAEIRFRRGPLPDDVRATLGALAALGFDLTVAGGATPVVSAPGGDTRPSRRPAVLDVGGSATALRVLAAVCALGPGPFTLTGGAQLRARPAGAIVPALRALGVSVRGDGPEDAPRPPLLVAGGPARGGRVVVDASRSSQVVSALLLAGPAFEEGTDVEAEGEVASEPYVELTVRTMLDFEVPVRALAGRWIAPPGGYPGLPPHRGPLEVAGDWSSAAFALAAAAATGGEVEVAGLGRDDPQADRRVVDLLTAMGADLSWTDGGVRSSGRVERPVEADLRDAPDLAPLVGALACLVPGTSRVRGAAHLRIKETDRIAEVVRCARALGCEAREHADGFEVTGPAAHGAAIDPAGDHRIAMAFAVAGLAVPGTRVLDPGCVAKSHPAFWDDLRALAGPF